MSSPCDQRVLVLFNQPPADAGLSDAGVLAQVKAVSLALDALGTPYRVAGVGRLADVVGAVSAGEEAVVFNLAEVLGGSPEDAAAVPALCEALGRACTGGSSACLSLTLDKVRTKGVLREHGIPVPNGFVVRPGEDLPRLDPAFGPVIVKPVAADASEGISADHSVTHGSGPALKGAVDRIHREFRQPALVEQLVGDRELNVSIFEADGRIEILPLAEIDFSAFPPGAPRIVDYAAKWVADSFAYSHTPRIIPADIPPETARRAEDLALAAWDAVGCMDYARVDMRLGPDGTLYVLEVNANPDLASDAGFAAALRVRGMAFESFVCVVLGNARARRDRKSKRTRPSAPVPTESRGLLFRPLRAGDRETVLELVHNAGVFRPDEEEVAREVLDDSIHRGEQRGYSGMVAELGGRVAGWVSFGAIPCTLDAYDVYWVAVDPQVRRRGIGTSLLDLAERQVSERGGRLLVIETSGRSEYEAARSLYIRCGYIEAARVPEFYAPQDDKVIYVKSIRPAKAG